MLVIVQSMDEYYLLQLWNVTKPKAIASIPFLNRHLKRGREQEITFVPWLRYQYQGKWSGISAFKQQVESNGVKENTAITAKIAGVIEPER